MGQTTDLRTCTCRSCGLTVTVGHPAFDVKEKQAPPRREIAEFLHDDRFRP